MTPRDRYPRTLNEAFGPYSTGPIEEPKRPLDWQDRVVLVACAITVLAILLLAWS